MRTISCLALVASVLVVGACSHPARFRPAKTVGKGEIEHVIGYQHSLLLPLEGGQGLLIEHPDLVVTFKGMPTYGFRYGISERFQLGAQFGWNLLRTEATFGLLEARWVDLAMGADLGIGTYPMTWEWYLKDVSWFGSRDEDERDPRPLGSFAIPLMLGLNPSRKVSLVTQVAPAYMGGWNLQYGVGVDIRLESVALRPHVTIVSPLHDGPQAHEQLPVLFGFDVALGSAHRKR